MAKPFPIHTTTKLIVRYLQTGEVLQDTDLYLSTSGEWQPCPCSGLTARDDSTWVRPVEDPEDDPLRP